MIVSFTLVVAYPLSQGGKLVSEIVRTIKSYDWAEVNRTIESLNGGAYVTRIRGVLGEDINGKEEFCLEYN